MATSFSALKKSRSKSFDKLSSQLQSMNSGGKTTDENVWKLEVDKAGNGYAVLRFLPPREGEDDRFVRIWDHGFKGPGGWYIENSLTTLGEDDPVSEFNGKLWNSVSDDSAPERKQARDQKRRLSFWANVYVVKDPANPANEGKVMKFKFGKKIFDKINDVVNPEFEDETAVDPFDLWEGADFKLKARQVEGYRNYDKSEFADPAPITKPDGTEMTDEEMEAVWKSEHSLSEIIDPKNFKTYAELQAKLNKVLGLTGNVHPTTTAEDDGETTPGTTQTSAPAETQTSAPVDLGETSGEDSLDYFNDLLNE